MLEDAQSPPEPLALRLLELNREMVAAKFEWDRTRSTIRLSVVLNTDSNFDRRAFRSLIEGLKGLAQNLWPELSQLVRPPTATAQTKKEPETKEKPETNEE